MTDEKNSKKAPKSNKILLIEDEETLSSMYQTKFGLEGFETKIAIDGEEGLKMAQDDDFDIILIDIIMPKLDGFAVLKELKAATKYRNTPIILLTNLGQDEDVEKGKKLGATDYLIKANYTPSQVLEKIKGYIANSKR